MTDLTLRPAEAGESGLAAVLQAIKEMFSATPLGIVLAVVRAKIGRAHV